MNPASTPKQKLLAFINAKANMIAEKCTLPYIDNADIAEVESWPDDTCESVWTRLCIKIERGNILNPERDAFGANACPWCQKHIDTGCSECLYGLRHGICTRHDSRYAQIGCYMPQDWITYGKLVELIKEIEGGKV